MPLARVIYNERVGYRFSATSPRTLQQDTWLLMDMLTVVQIKPIIQLCLTDDR